MKHVFGKSVVVMENCCVVESVCFGVVICSTKFALKTKLVQYILVRRLQ